MKPVPIGNDVWHVRRVPDGSASLVDRTGIPKLATTDPTDRSINLSSSLMPPLLDRVLLHEVAHAITISYGLLPSLRSSVPEGSWIAVEEWIASFMEGHAAEAVALASESLGRPLCIDGHCVI